MRFLLIITGGLVRDADSWTLGTGLCSAGVGLGTVLGWEAAVQGAFSPYQGDARLHLHVGSRRVSLFFHGLLHAQN